MLVRKLPEFGALVRQRRQELRLSQSELAERAGITRQLLSRFEQGKSDPGLATLLTILRELGLSLDARTREERAEIVEVRIPSLPRISVPAINETALDSMRRALMTFQERTRVLPLGVDAGSSVGTDGDEKRST